MQIFLLPMTAKRLKFFTAFVFLLLGITNRLGAKIIEPSVTLSMPPGTTGVLLTTPTGTLEAKDEPEAFSLPHDEVHATAEFAGARLLTGTKDGKWSAFTIERKGNSFEVIELSKRALAWQLSKIVISWSVVAVFLFSALFALADKSRRATQRK